MLRNTICKVAFVPAFDLVPVCPILEWAEKMLFFLNSGLLFMIVEIVSVYMSIVVI